MRDFSWQYFSNTGSIEAYILFKQVTERHSEDDKKEQVPEENPEMPS